MRFTRVTMASTLAVALLATAACGSDDSGADGGKVKLTIATFGEFGYKALYKEYMTGESECGDHGADHQDRGSPQEPRGSPGDEHRVRRTSRRSRRAGSVSSRRNAGQVLQLERVRWRRRSRRSGRRGSGSRRSAADGTVDRSGHGRRRYGDVLPHGHVREGAACRPTVTRCRSCGRRGRSTSRRARSSRPRRKDPDRVLGRSRRSCTGRFWVSSRWASTTATRSSWRRTRV